MMKTLTPTEQQLLHLVQSNFPLTPRPYQALGQILGTTEQNVIDMLRSLKTRGILRQISAIFDAKSLGFTSALAGFQLQEGAIDYAAECVNAHPGVSHNYKREHQFNLWFTLSIPKELDIQQHVKCLARMTSCSRYLFLPSVRMFKRHVHLAINDAGSDPGNFFSSDLSSSPKSGELSLSPGLQRQIMSELQKDLPLTPTPFYDIAAYFNVKKETVLILLTYLKTSKKMRRFAGILRHRNLGFTANAMVVWKIPEKNILPFVKRVATYTAISHCYERISYPEWPYNIYTMIHGKSQEFTERIIHELSSTCALHKYETLYSSTEYKKQRVNYFGQEIYEWDQQYVSIHSYAKAQEPV